MIVEAYRQSVMRCDMLNGLLGQLFLFAVKRDISPIYKMNLWDWVTVLYSVVKLVLNPEDTQDTHKDDKSKFLKLFERISNFFQ